MTNRYFDLIDQTFYFPQDGFELEDGHLEFNGIPLMHLIEKYGTPLRLTYLPSIAFQIKKARNRFNRAIKELQYQGKYHYCYCTKSNHFSFVINEVLEQGSHLEISSAFDVDLILSLYQLQKITKDITIICNGYKPDAYIKKIAELINNDFENVIPVIDNRAEVQKLSKYLKKPCKLGIRMATEEEPNFEFYTSRLGIHSREIIDIYKTEIKDHPLMELKMLHFFIDTGIKDSMYYWGELNKGVETYATLKKECESLDALNIGGGMPIRNSLSFDFDYKYMINNIVKTIKDACIETEIPTPDIYSEFGQFTVGESGAIIYGVLDQKQQNDTELWYMIDNSLMNTLPDTWGISQRFILLPINKWYNDYTKVNIGGLSCDNSDYYNSEVHVGKVFLPIFDKKSKEPLYIGFFHTGAYQESISGFGGIKHCLIPAPKHVLIDKDKKGNLIDTLVYDEQNAESMLRILGYL